MTTNAKLLSDALAFLEVMESQDSLSSKEEVQSRQAHELAQRFRAQGVEPSVPWPPVQLTEEEARAALEEAWHD